MHLVVAGGAGFLGRWVVRSLLARGDSVLALDDLSNGSEGNVAEFGGNAGFRLLRGDVRDRSAVAKAFAGGVDQCYHLAAMIEVQKSLDDPVRAMEVNVNGTLNVLEACRHARAKMILVSTCMIYDKASSPQGIAEDHPVKPASPYAASKLAAEYLALSYGLGYGLPVTVLRPFNIYGPFQKTNQEGGVVAVFLRRALDGRPLEVFWAGTQTRHLLYVEDCVDFLLRAGDSSQAEGEGLNAGTGREVTINELAGLVAGPGGTVRHVAHPHPLSEIARLRCDAGKAARLLGWKPRTPLEAGLRRTREWMAG